MINFETLAARALTTSRSVHRPTYVGLRLMLEQIKQGQSELLTFLEQRTQSRKAWRYFSFPLLKEVKEYEKNSHRLCMTGSPITVLAEAYVLSLMARSELFQPHPAVFSYLWPQPKRSGRNFEYFFDGYTRRNQLVTRLLKRHPDHIALISDIQQFYPSVDPVRLKQKLYARTAKLDSKTNARAINSFVDSLLDAGKPKHTGIPIGPDLSHFLGNVALEDVDHKMYRSHGERYLRYVDDIIVVCHRSERETVERSLSTLVEEEGLHLHEGKRDMVEALTWIENDPLKESELKPFESLIDSILMYLFRNFRDRDIHVLQRSLIEEGFSLPIQRLAGLARSGRFRAFMNFRLIRQKGLRLWLLSLFDTPKTIVSRAAKVRSLMTQSWIQHHEERMPRGSMTRRWYVQKCRYVFNRMLYLRPPEDYRTIANGFSDLPELAEGRIVAHALSTRDATAVLKCPGRVTEIFCQLWSERHGASPPHVSWPNSPDWAEASSAANMALFFPLDLPIGFIEGLSERSPGCLHLINITNRWNTAPLASQIREGTYLDELNLLLQNTPRERIYQMVTSRFDETEGLELDALHLGSSGWSPGG